MYPLKNVCKCGDPVLANQIHHLLYDVILNFAVRHGVSSRSKDIVGRTATMFGHKQNNANLGTPYFAHHTAQS